MKKTAIILGALGLFACEKETTPPVDGGKTYTSGVFIQNEGAFLSGEATLSHYNPSNKTVTATAFFDKNDFTLSDVFQSMTITGGKAYMLSNRVHVIEVANALTLASEGQITGITDPRFMAVDGNTGYVSSWGDDAIKVIDLSSNTVTGSIPVGLDPEAVLVHNGMLYVANSGGNAFYPALPDSTVSVIDLSTNTEIAKIQVGKAPNSLQMDANGDLWVMCAGLDVFNDEPNSTIAKLVKIDLSDNSTTMFDFPDKTLHPAKMQINGSLDKLYYLGGGYGGNVYTMSTSDATVSTTPMITRSFYGLGIDPNNGDIYGGTPVFGQNAKMYRYDMLGSVLDSAEVGVAPNGFNFIN